MSPVEPLQQTEKFALRADIKGAGRFVGNQQGRAVKHRHGDQYALRLSDADLVWVAAKESVVRGKVHFVQ